ncbi:MAG: GAF domain-containing protein [Planctomycetota bacterium]|nr:GAF domain-containing protein [Planctomycetota bacterium]
MTEHGAERDAPAPSARLALASLAPISEALGADKSPKEVLQLIVKAAFSITRATSASLMLIEPETGTLKVEVAEGFKDKRIFSTRLAVGEGVTGWVAETGVPLRIGNARNDPRYVRVQRGLRSELAVPMKIRGRVIGVISVDSTRLNHFTAEDEALLLSLAAQSARVIQTTRLHEEYVRVQRRMLAAEEALRNAEKLSVLGELAAGLAHEIRNPLTSIKVLFGTLAKSQALPPETAQDVEMIERQIARLEAIVEGFLATARAQASPEQFKAMDLNATVDEALLLLASSAGEGTRLAVNLCPGELKVRGDPTQLSQAVYNLVLNAIQAVGKHGRVTVTTGRVPPAALREPLAAPSPGDAKPEVFLEVADEGPGLPASVSQRLFQPFVTTRKAGVGLGLSIVKRIAGVHGGRVEVESPRADIGHGALFRIVLPEAARA